MSAVEEGSKYKNVLSESFQTNAQNMINNEESLTVSFGQAPEKIILKFISLCEQHSSLSLCLQYLLAKQTKRTLKYQFQPLTESARDWHVIVSRDEDMDQLQKALQDLDDYVHRNRLKDRASGIEELLFGTTDEEDNDVLTPEDKQQNNLAIEFPTTTEKSIFVVKPNKQEPSADNSSNSCENLAKNFCCPDKCNVDFLEKVTIKPLKLRPMEQTQEDNMEVLVHDDIGEYLQGNHDFETSDNKDWIDITVLKKKLDVKKSSESCSVCKRKFQSKYKLRQHIKRFHPEVPLQCPICNEIFETKMAVQVHCRQVHQRHLSIDKRGNIALVNRELLKCDQCDYVALRGGRMSTHRKKVHGIIDEIQCAVCDKVFDSYRAHNHHVYQFHTLVDVACDICGKICRNRASFHRHYLSHTQTFQCSMCDKTFRDRRSHLQHEKRHVSVNIYSCQFCGRKFNQKANLKRHVQVLHLKTGRLMCEFCCFTTFYNNALRDHVDRVHHGIKKINFTCRHCSKTFDRRHTYEEHVDKHEGRYRYSCEVCGKKYRNKSGCKKHSLQCIGGKDLVPSDQSDTMREKMKAKENVEEEEIGILETVETTHDHMDLVYTLTETLVETTSED